MFEEVRHKHNGFTMLLCKDVMMGNLRKRRGVVPLKRQNQRGYWCVLEEGDRGHGCCM